MYQTLLEAIALVSSGDVPVPAKLSYTLIPDDRRAGSINGHLLRALRVRLQY